MHIHRGVEPWEKGRTGQKRKKCTSPSGNAIHSFVNNLVRIPGSPPLPDWLGLAGRFGATACVWKILGYLHGIGSISFLKTVKKNWKRLSNRNNMNIIDDRPWGWRCDAPCCTGTLQLLSFHADMIYFHTKDQKSKYVTDHQASIQQQCQKRHSEPTKVRWHLQQRQEKRKKKMGRKKRCIWGGGVGVVTKIESFPARSEACQNAEGPQGPPGETGL